MPQYYLDTGLHSQRVEKDFVVLSIREKLEDNLMNAMDSAEGTCETAEDKPVLMFKIASKSKNVLI